MNSTQIKILILLLIPFCSRAQNNCFHCPSSTILYNKLLHKPVAVNLREFCNGCNINDSIKKRLLYLLIPEWTAAEIEENVIKEIEQNKDFYRLEEKARIIGKGNDSLYKISYDSIIKGLKKGIADNLKNSMGVNESIIKVVGYLDMEEAVQVLKKNFNLYNIQTVKLALARLGNKKYQEEIINLSKPDTSFNNNNWLNDFQKKGMNLCYIATQESIYALNEWIDTSKSLNLRTHITKSANIVLQYLYNIILNEDFLIRINTSLDFQDVYDLANTDVELLIYCKQWLIKNKGKYKINRNLYAWPDARRIIKKQ